MPEITDAPEPERVEKAHVVAPVGIGGGLSRIANKYFKDDATPTEAPVETLVGTHCVVDGVEIKMLAFKMTGVCCELCRKVRDGEITEEAYNAARVQPAAAVPDGR